MTEDDDDVEFFELAPDGRPLPEHSVDLLEVSGDRPAGRATPRERLAALPGQIRSVPDAVKVLVALCVVAAAVGGFVFGRSTRPTPAGGSALYLPAVSSPASAQAASSSVTAPAEDDFSFAGGQTACRNVSDDVVLATAPANLVQAVHKHLPRATVDTGSSVTNELGRACSATLSAHIEATGTQIELTVTAPPSNYAGTGVNTIKGQGLAQGFEAQYITADGWIIDATAQLGGTAALTAALGYLVTDTSLIVSPS